MANNKRKLLKKKGEQIHLDCFPGICSRLYTIKISTIITRTNIYGHYLCKIINIKFRKKLANKYSMTLQYEK